MSHSCRDANYIVIYALYNKDDEIVMTGTCKECCEFLEVDKDYFYKAYSSKVLIKFKYRIYRIGKEPISEKKCSACGQIKPISEFPKRKNTKGILIPSARCIDCQRAYYRKKMSNYYKKKKEVKV